MTISELAERAPIIVLSKKACVQCNMSKKLLTGKLGEPADGTWVTAMIDEDPDLYAEVAEKYPARQSTTKQPTPCTSPASYTPY